MKNLIIKKLNKKHTNYPKTQKKGFTLVELIVNMAIIGIIMVIVTSLTGSSINAFNRHKNSLDSINLGSLIISTIESKVSKAGHAKLENFFEEKDGVATDQTNDGNIDYYLYNKDNYQVPVCLDELWQYSSIFIKPDSDTKLNKDKNGLTGSERKGKVYILYANPTAKTDFVGEKFYVKTEDGKELVYVPLIDERIYKGYSVDVRFEYISSADTEKDKDIDISLQPGVGLNGNLNCIKIIVDVYNGNKKVNSTTGTINFMQMNFKMDPVRVSYSGEKSILFFA